MPVTTALLPLTGFFLTLLAYWCWTRAREAATDASLQRRLWDHSKYQRDFQQTTPLEVSEWFHTERRKYQLYAVGTLLLALACFVYTALMFITPK
ncbi:MULTISPECIES: hypothetical protein [Deinococcus]|uniref:Uncharacterized protein n=1 Tax=Deinococcus cavernae TaxID=2320857 RepID=A0A418V9D8_9DEIO|nr:MULTISPECIES: hypothetical protein [Deinococcus]RJF72713.1 hypothetical protein D3875_15370 [Deinococcus cavernae]